MIRLVTWTPAATLVQLARPWCVRQILMSLTAWRRTRSVLEPPVMIRLVTWTPAATLVQLARPWCVRRILM
eukprot:COSAG02_NODE_57394_length_280_cov_40.917127_1_plen_70_part_10